MIGGRLFCFLCVDGSERHGGMFALAGFEKLAALFYQYGIKQTGKVMQRFDCELTKGDVKEEIYF